MAHFNLDWYFTIVPDQQPNSLDLESKIFNGIERLSEALKSLLWDKAKIHGISPIQIQILLFVDSHSTHLSNVSHLAKEFNVTKATISDAVRVLVTKDLLQRDYSPTDSRRYDLLITKKGSGLVKELSLFATPFMEELSHFSRKELTGFFETLSKLIYRLNQRNVIQVQRSCFNCRYYVGNRENKHHCNLLQTKLRNHELRLDCPEFEQKIGEGS
ncbi:MAG: MarR family winged helix-turn-helix transcriptional regulator [Saprospiraceae bacterium]|nr:MarR family winged helix-turn-helix transcriptional regulator [Saprospiraceae bacterium]